jgi:hypothetical protein
MEWWIDGVVDKKTSQSGGRKTKTPHSKRFATFYAAAQAEGALIAFFEGDAAGD